MLVLRDMVLNWLLFFALSFGAYILIALFGQLTAGESTTLWQVALAEFKPLPLAIILFANAVWATGLYFGFKNTNLALPIAISIGVVTGFVYSLLFLDATFTPLKLLGVALVLGGIFLMQ